jgi:D-lactate dehydrogenase
VLRRELARQRAGSPVQRALLEEFEYDALETCAADGTCVLACPVGIDTGKLVKELRGRQHTDRAERAALGLARRWSAVERAARAGLRAGHPALARTTLRGATRAARAAISAELLPQWPQNMPPPAPSTLPRTARDGAAAVYLPACVNRIFGRAHDGGAGGLSLPEALTAVSARAELPLWIPDDSPGHCCATPWSSKGYDAAAGWMANHTVEALWGWSEEGALPIVCDASSCTLGLVSEIKPLLSEANAERHGRLEVLDSIGWTRRRLLPRLDVGRRLGSAVVHPTCASRHLANDVELAEIAAALAEHVVVPVRATCCGFAGDRGLLHPELPLAATAEEAAEVASRPFDLHLCSNRTCEIGLQQGTGRRYESFLFALEELTRAGERATGAVV